ncbi:MAG: S9 family peptidase [Piscinibacter sp.]|uniref:S9 family peptidase n=1 Tax=Piscinibacter sp. TaxID=1903157 RepID=UPI00258D78A7|nr:prolyl oligopeptidase family serine peptidase [Piscinibacter sp.]MCW5662738.1 S9 family peptidase [Piscinibacter sp.]
MIRLLLTTALWLLSACAAPPGAPPAPAAAAAEPVIAPNPALVVQGIPPVPARLADAVARYTDFRGHAFVEWHPLRREMLVTHRPAGGSTAQLFRIAAPLAEPEQLTDGPDPVREASWEPQRGEYLVFERASRGDEATQLFRLDLATRELTLLTDPKERHEMQGWLHGTSRLLVMSMPLDRTAAGGSRARVSQVLSLVDPAQPTQRRRIAELPGSGWFVGGVAQDDRSVALTRWISATESQLWLLRLDAGRRVQLLPAPKSRERAAHLAGGFRRDGRGLWLLSDRDGEFLQLSLFDLGTKKLRPLTRHIPWDVERPTASEDGRWLAVQANVDGRDELRLFDARRLTELKLPPLPAGRIGQAGFHRSRAELAFSVSSATSPSQVWTLAPEGGAAEAWTRVQAPDGAAPEQFAEARVVRWTSFDGRGISGLLTLPPARFEGRRPVLIDIHGGPESQARAGFLDRSNYFVEELGLAVIRPNVRGSSGYGKAFLALDDGRKREDAVKDIGALLDWIATQPRLDATRVVVGGGSYGGFMSLATAATYADRIAGAIDVVGISNIVSFLRNTESYRRDLRRAEYGDERDEAMREYLERISPLSNAHRIVKPLFVVQGRNDPRVPWTEAEQIVARVRANGTPVWYLRAENEDHGFVRKENADFQFYATVLFLRQVLRLD